MEVYDALKIALEELRAKNLMHSAEYRLTASRVDGEWVFWFVFLPETFGLDVTARVNDDGKVSTLVGF